MARAKMTDRAEARRRYRAYLAQQDGSDVSETTEDEAASAQDSQVARARNPQGGRSAAAGPVARVGFFQAMKMAYRTPHYREDLRGIVPLITQTKAIWPVALICVIAAAVSYPQIKNGVADPNDPVLSITLQFILAPLPLLPPMIAGFLAPRATWLAGIIAALISTFCLVVLLIVSGVIKTNEIGPGLVQALSEALPFGAMFGALSGWYKRFLGLTSVGSPRQRATAGGKQTSRPRR